MSAPPGAHEGGSGPSRPQAGAGLSGPQPGAGPSWPQADLSPPAASLAWQGLAHRYPGAEWLRFADLAPAPATRRWLLLGPSGSGKSTLLALLAGLLAPMQGELVVLGTRLARLSGPQRDAWRSRHVGFVPQRLHLSASLSVVDNLAMPYVAAGLRVDTVRVHAVLQALALTTLAQRLPHQLSVGQAQRVAIARAVVRQPGLLLADEPSAALDDGHTERMLALLDEAAEATGAILLVATHDARLSAAWPQAGRVVLPPLAQPPAPVHGWGTD